MAMGAWDGKFVYRVSGPLARHTPESASWRADAARKCAPSVKRKKTDGRTEKPSVAQRQTTLAPPRQLSATGHYVHATYQRKNERFKTMT